MSDHRHRVLVSGAHAFNPPGCLSQIAEKLRLSQAIIIPPNSSLVVTSGQCGFKEDLSFPPSVHEEVTLAFENAQRTLETAGVTEGWKNVYHITTYAPSMDEELLNAIQAAKERFLGANRPAWTGVTVRPIYGGARLEMTVYAFIQPVSKNVNKL